MENLIPLEDIVEENVRVKELEKQGFIINPEKIDSYLEEFKGRTTTFPNKEYWNEKIVLITGISGFAGSHLAEQLLDLGCEVHGTIRRHAIITAVLNNIIINIIMSNIQLVLGSLAFKI